MSELERRALGLTGLRVPVLGLGARQAFNVFGKESQAARRSLIDAALEKSINFFETSPTFGESERILGSSLTGRRQRGIVATSVPAGAMHLVHDQIDRSLRLFEERIDIYLVEQPSLWIEYRPMFEHMKAKRSLRAAGVTCEQESDFPLLATLMRERAVEVIQIPYNPIEREAERVILPLAAELGIGVIVMRPFLEGELLVPAPNPNHLRRLRKFGARTWPQVVLKWILSDRRVSVVVPATRKVQHLEENAGAGSGPWFGPAERQTVAELAYAVFR